MKLSIFTLILILILLLVPILIVYEVVTYFRVKRRQGEEKIRIAREQERVLVEIKNNLNMITNKSNEEKRKS